MYKESVAAPNPHGCKYSRFRTGFHEKPMKKV